MGSPSLRQTNFLSQCRPPAPKTRLTPVPSVPRRPLSLLAPAAQRLLLGGCSLDATGPFLCQVATEKEKNKQLTAESYGVSAQVGSGAVWAAFREGPAGFQRGPELLGRLFLFSPAAALSAAFSFTLGEEHPIQVEQKAPWFDKVLAHGLQQVGGSRDEPQQETRKQCFLGGSGVSSRTLPRKNKSRPVAPLIRTSLEAYTWGPNNLCISTITRSSSTYVRISWYPLFLQSILVGEPFPKKETVKGNYRQT